MKRMSRQLSLAITLLTVIGLTVPALAQTLPQDMVPFKATVSGGLPDMFVLPLAPPKIFARVSATGQATDLGAFTYLEHHTAHLDVHGAIRSTTDAYSVMTAANGDAIFFLFSGLVQPTTNPPGLTAELAYTVTGGKGRFAGAMGSGIVRAVADMDKMTMICTYEGVISTPKP